MESFMDRLSAVTAGQVFMRAVGTLLIYLGVKKQYEPTLLIPFGMGAILVNILNPGLISQEINGVNQEGILDVLFELGISNELFPLLIFIGKGLELMGVGMLGVFTVLFILYLISIVLIRLFPAKERKDTV